MEEPLIPTGEIFMMDAILVAAGLIFFVVAIAYTLGCDRL